MTDDEAIDMLMKVLDHFKWNIAVPVTQDDEHLPGMVIGEDEYLNKLIGDNDDYIRR